MSIVTDASTFAAVALCRLLDSDDRPSEAMPYARAALGSFRQAGLAAAAAAVDAEQLVARLEQRGEHGVS